MAHPSQQQPGNIRQSIGDPVNGHYGRAAHQKPILYPTSQPKQPRTLYMTENQRLVGAQPFERNPGDVPHRLSSPHLSSRHSERFLPSVEGASQSVRDQPILFEKHVEHVSPVLNQNALVNAGGPAPKVFRLNNAWDQSDMKRRRVEGFASFSREEPPRVEAAYARQTTLIPLQDEDVYPIAGLQPAQFGYDTEGKPMSEEEQMLLPHGAEATSDSNRQKRFHIAHPLEQEASQRRYIVDVDKSRYAPGEHFQIQLSRAGHGHQIDLISKPLGTQPNMQQLFPTSPTRHKHVSTSYGAVDPYVSLHPNENFNARVDRRAEGASVVRTGQSRFKKPEKAVQSGSRALGMRPRRNEQDVEKYKDGQMMGIPSYDDLQYGESNRYDPTEPRTDRYGHWQPSQYGNARPSFQELESKREAHNQSGRPTGQLMPMDHYSEVQYPALTGSDERHVVRLLARSQEPQRYDLHWPMIQLGPRSGPF